MGRHPDVLCLPESEFKVDLFRYLKKRGPQTGDAVLRFLSNNTKFRLWQVPLELSTDSSVDEFGIGSIYEKLVSEYAEMVQKRDFDLWVDHSPSNIDSVASLARVFPDSRFIHIVRDGRAVANSIIDLDWGPNTITGAARWWSQRLSYGLAAETSENWPTMRVQFERLIAQPRVVVAEICDFVGLSVDEAMFAPGGFMVPRWTTEQHERVGSDFDSEAVGGWKTELTLRQIEIFEHESRDLLALLGYEPVFGGGTVGPTSAERSSEFVIELWRSRVLNAWRFRRRMGIPLFRSRARSPAN